MCPEISKSQTKRLNIQLPLLLVCSECDTPLEHKRDKNVIVVDPCIVCLTRLNDEVEDIYSEVSDEFDLDVVNVEDLL